MLTCDGAGDNVSASVRVWGGGKCEEIAITPEGDSLGAVYSWVTYGMGFVPLEHEYKLMGMGPYASDKAAEETAKVFHRYLRLRADGLGFQRGTRRQTHFIHECLERDLRGMRFDYICAGLQRFTEDMLCDWVQHAVRKTGVRKVLAAGGVFMNVKANKRIAELPEVDSFEAFPSCGDETLSIGAYTWNPPGDLATRRSSRSSISTWATRLKSPTCYPPSRRAASTTSDRPTLPTRWLNCWPRDIPWPAVRGRWSLAPGPWAIARSWPIRNRRTWCASSIAWSRSATSGCRLPRWSRKRGNTTTSKIPRTCAARS